MDDSKFEGLTNTAATYSLSEFKSEDVSENLVEVTKALYEGDRRLDERFDMDSFALKIRSYSASNGWTDAQTVNFSRGGALIESVQDYQEGTRLWLYIDTKEPLTGIAPFLIGAEVRHTSSGESGYLIGVQFRLEMIKDMRRTQAAQSMSQLEAFLQTVSLDEKT